MTEGTNLCLTSVDVVLNTLTCFLTKILEGREFTEGGVHLPFCPVVLCIITHDSATIFLFFIGESMYP